MCKEDKSEKKKPHEKNQKRGRRGGGEALAGWVDS